MARRSTPPAASSVWVEMPFMRGPVGAQRLREWLPVSRDIRAKTAARRARVLAHEWACKRLCVILDIKEARHWNGYIPTGDDRQQVRRNPSREALIALLKEVAAADQVEPEELA